MNLTSPHPQLVPTPLIQVALETERYVARAGWDQPPRLFALVETSRLLAAEPSLAAQLATESQPAEAQSDALSAIEQDNLPHAHSLEELLAQLAWPPEVDGAAIAVERIVLPPEALAELPSELPQDEEQAAQLLADHPQRADVRLLAAVLRDGTTTCLLRQRAHDADDQVAVGAEIAPGLLEALGKTLVSD